MPMTSCALGIDVGGTKILIGLVDDTGAVLYSRKYKMDRTTQRTALTSIFSALEDFWDTAAAFPTPTAIGMGTVGHIDPEKGIWLQSYNIPISEPVPVAEILHTWYSLPVRLDNDVHSAAMGESSFGAGKDAGCMLYLNVGTGLSAGIVANGRLLRGADNYAGEIGYMDLNAEGELRRLEPMASGGGLISEALRLLDEYPGSSLRQLKLQDKLHSAGIFAAAEEGDPLAYLLYQRAVRYLGCGICNLMAVVNPDVIALGGGVISGGNFLADVKAYVEENCVGETLRSLRYFGPSLLDPDKIGLIGAAAIAMNFC